MQSNIVQVTKVRQQIFLFNIFKSNLLTVKKQGNGADVLSWCSPFVGQKDLLMA